MEKLDQFPVGLVTGVGRWEAASLQVEFLAHWHKEQLQLFIVVGSRFDL